MGQISNILFIMILILCLPSVYREEVFIVDTSISTIQLIYVLVMIQLNLPGYLILYLRNLSSCLSFFIPNLVFPDIQQIHRDTNDRLYGTENALLGGLLSITQILGLILSIHIILIMIENFLQMFKFEKQRKIIHNLRKGYFQYSIYIEFTQLFLFSSLLTSQFIQFYPESMNSSVLLRYMSMGLLTCCIIIYIIFWLVNIKYREKFFVPFDKFDEVNVESQLDQPGFRWKQIWQGLKEVKYLNFNQQFLMTKKGLQTFFLLHMSEPDSELQGLITISFLSIFYLCVQRPYESRRHTIKQILDEIFLISLYLILYNIEVDTLEEESKRNEIALKLIMIITLFIIYKFIMTFIEAFFPQLIYLYNWCTKKNRVMQIISNRQEHIKDINKMRESNLSFRQVVQYQGHHSNNQNSQPDHTTRPRQLSTNEQIKQLDLEGQDSRNSFVNLAAQRIQTENLGRDRQLSIDSQTRRKQISFQPNEKQESAHSQINERQQSSDQWLRNQQILIHQQIGEQQDSNSQQTSDRQGSINSQNSGGKESSNDSLGSGSKLSNKNFLQGFFDDYIQESQYSSDPEMEISSSIVLQRSRESSPKQIFLSNKPNTNKRQIYPTGATPKSAFSRNQ